MTAKTSKTGDDTMPGTAEGAVMGRAAHSLHDPTPVFDDTWAVEMLTPAARAAVRDPGYLAGSIEKAGFDARPILALGLACLRHADEVVARAAAQGVRQYVVLGAGFDTFALRRGDLTDRLKVFEVDFPDVQVLKRERIAAAERKPAALPEFVPIDFEKTRLSEALAASSFRANEPAIFSWLNSVPYVSEEAVRATLDDLGQLCAPGSQLFFNYSPAAPLTEAQKLYLGTLMQTVASLSEPFRSRFAPDAMEAMLAESGFAVLEHLNEDDLGERYCGDRSDSLRPGLPARAVLVERRA